MSRALKMLVLTALLAIGVLGVNVAGASAATAGAASCAFNGLAGIANPGVKSVQNDIAASGVPGFLTSTDSGSYTFNGPATCVVVDGSGATPVQSVTINSAGTYVNSVCGTGTADGNPGGTTVTGGASPFSAVNYHIDFRGGQGTLRVSNAHDDATGDDYSGAGHVVIVPTTGNCVTTDVTQFTVAGAFALTHPKVL
jgi:hypothetical protein